MADRLKGKRALVTGGAGGIGAAIAALFVAEGAQVILTDRDPAALSAACAQLGSPHILPVTCDIANEDDVRRLADSIRAAGDALDVLVNNAAVREHSSLGAADAASWRRILDVNVIGTSMVTATCLPWLRRSGRGAIVNVASTYGISGRAGMGQYDATKAAIVAASRVLAIEEAKNSVRVNVVCPGSVLTGFTLGRAAARGLSEAELRDHGFVPAPIARWGEPAEIAAPVLWLASDEASFITGAVLPVDGGVSASGTRLPA
jgi:2-hydroxycyclohexanecarboxyl-CoA dehydrogenase